MPDKTIQQAADELHAAVLAMRELIEREYPSRREVERRFISRDAGKQRWATAVALILASSFVSFILSVTTISGCFLGSDLDHSQACMYIPGYQDSVKENKEVLKEFVQLQERSLQNERRIDELEKKEAK